MRGNEIIGGHNTILRRNLLPAVGVNCRLFSLRIAAEVRRILDRDHPCHDRLNLRRRSAARPCERLIDTLKERTEFREYGAESFGWGFAVLEIHLEPTGKAFVLPLPLELICSFLIALLECDTNVCVQFGKLGGKWRVLVLLCLSLAPRCPLPDGLKLLCVRRRHICKAFEVKEEEVPHLVKECGFICILKE